MSTVQTIVDELRVRLEESTARKWSDADQLIPYVNEAERWLARLLSHIPKSNRFRYRQTFTIAANAETYDLTGLTKKFDWMISLAVQVSNLWVPCGVFEDDDEQPLSNLSLGGGTLVPRVSIADDTLLFEPAFQSARTARIRYGYIPTIKTSSVTTLETPDEYLLDIINRALWFAQADAGISNEGQMAQLAQRELEIEALERARLGISNERVVLRARTFNLCR